MPITTTKVRNRISARAGNSGPAFTVSGIAKAAASDTTPRIPAQATTNAPRADGAFSRESSRGSSAIGITHSIRTTTTVTSTATAATISELRLCPRSPESTVGSCSPMSRNTNDSSTTSAAFHTAVSCSRVA